MFQATNNRLLKTSNKEEAIDEESVGVEPNDVSTKADTSNDNIQPDEII